VELRRHLGEVLKRLAEQKESQIEEGHLMPDHVHLMISILPKYAVSQVVGYIKGKSAIHMARVGGNGAVAVNRATPSAGEIAQVFGGRIESGTLVVLTDGNKPYQTLENECQCEVISLQREESAPSGNINTANAFHSFIKGRLGEMHGVATKYLNRYAALFSRVWRGGDHGVDDIYNDLCSNTHDSCSTIRDVRMKNLTLV
jgi:hypothetical protein